MCTAVSDCKKYHLFGRTFDYERSFGEELVITPEKFRFDFEKGKDEKEKSYALMGIACVKNGVPLYFDAINEASLGGAALNFPKSCVYRKSGSMKENVPSFELLLRVLRSCSSVKEAKEFLENVNVSDESFDSDIAASPLHWIFADRHECICVESVESGVKVYTNLFRVLTNEPPFPYHELRIRDFLYLRSVPFDNTLCRSVSLDEYSRGGGGYGLPGDFSSSSRFVRAVFMKNHTELCPCDDAEKGEVQRFFHIIDSVSVPYGAVKTKANEPVCTIYCSCANTDTLAYYYTTYLCREIKCVRMSDFSLDGRELINVPIYGT